MEVLSELAQQAGIPLTSLTPEDRGRIRDGQDVRQLMSSADHAETIARALCGRQSGDGWMALCPAHDDRYPSLSIRDTDDGKVLVYCHAGCDQMSVIGELRARGLWGESRGSSGWSVRPHVQQVTEREPDQGCADKSRAALRIWQAAAPPLGTLVESYFESRGIHVPIPTSIRFHPGLKHRSGSMWPGLVALVTRGNDALPVAIHRTFLSRDGRGKAPVEPQKMMLGPCHGGAVRLTPPADVLMIGEGIETCLAVMQATGLPTWAALSTSGLRSLELPGEVSELVVLADGDDSGEKAAVEAGNRWKREGRVSVVDGPRNSLVIERLG